MSSPRIGITGTTRLFDGALRSGVNAAYVSATVRAGGLPLILPPVIRSADIPAILDDLDGLLLSGGEDIDPALFSEEPHPRLGRIDPDRDRFELAIFLEAWQRRTPVLAICRGIQVVNVALGGTLWQDIPSQRPGGLPHSPTANRDQRTHEVELIAGSRTAQALGTTRFDTNSFHHQSIKLLAPGLIVTGTAPDGEIEAVEPGGEAGWMLAVQWHPEEFYHQDSAPDRGLFAAFMVEARRESLTRMTDGTMTDQAMANKR